MKSKLTAFRIPEALKQAAEAYCRAHDLHFSQLVRRAIRKELGRVDGTTLPEEQ